MALTREQFIELEGNIQKTYDRYMENKIDYMPMMMNVSNSQKAVENHFGVGAFGRMTEWNGSVAYDSMVKGYTNSYRHTKYSTGVQVEQDLFDDQEYQAIKTRVNNVAYGVYKTLQNEGASIYNSAFTTSVTGPDSVSLCNSAHHNVPGDTAQSNTGVLDLTYDNIETVMLAMRNFTDDRGDIMDVLGDCIIAGTYWARTLKQLLGSQKEAFTADNQINAYSDIQYIINPYITGKKWFVINKDMAMGGDGANFFMRRDPRKLERDSDFDAEVLKWKSVGRWSKGWDNWFWIFGNNPA